jgi:hypothetical protein
MAERFSQVTSELRTNPATVLAQQAAAGSPAVPAYLWACTGPSDRLLAFTFVPELFYATQRGFAAGHVAFVEGHHADTSAQSRAVALWRAQPVPFVIAFERQLPRLSRAFPLIAAEVQHRYVRVYRSPGQEGRGPLLVFAARDRASVSTYAPLGAPCYAGPPRA